jgi:hypothetical protein
LMMALSGMERNIASGHKGDPTLPVCITQLGIRVTSFTGEGS